MTYKATFAAKKSVFFDGSSGHLQATHPGAGAANCNPREDEDFSLTYWFQPAITTQYRCMFSTEYCKAASSTICGFKFLIGFNSQLAVEARGETGSSYTLRGSLLQPHVTYGQTWHCAAYTYEGTAAANISSFDLWLNTAKQTLTGSGALGVIDGIGEINVGRSVSTGSSGSITGYGNYWRGSLAHIAFWNKKLTEQEIQEVYLGRDGNLGPGDLRRHSAAANLKGWWISDNPSDTYNGTIYDSSGNSVNLTPSGLASDELYYGAP